MLNGITSIQSNEKQSAHRVVFGFGDLTDDPTPIAGGKGASLARMTAAGMPVPPGFIVCASALTDFLAGEGLSLVEKLTTRLNVDDSASLNHASTAICEWIQRHSMPAHIENAVTQAYSQFCGGAQEALVAVRSSGISEDGETASFAGQQETYLNVCGADAVVGKVRDCWASFFSPRAMFYRASKGTLADVAMAVVVQQMVQAEKSGVMFTVDPIDKRLSCMVIEAVFGLGEGIVSGTITPDHHVIEREDGSVVAEFIAMKPIALVWDSATQKTSEIELDDDKANSRVLSDQELDSLRRLGLKLEEHFGKPQDVEWSIASGRLMLLQSRPITTI
jgi:pyruvate, water dikinase